MSTIGSSPASCEGATGLARPLWIALGVVLDVGQVHGLHYGRHVYPEWTAESFLQAVPAPNRVLRRASPCLDGSVRRRLLLVRGAEEHPVALFLEHPVQVLDAPEMIPQLRRTGLHDERGWIERFVAERRELRGPARSL